MAFTRGTKLTVALARRTVLVCDVKQPNVLNLINEAAMAAVFRAPQRQVEFGRLSTCPTLSWRFDKCSRAGTFSRRYQLTSSQWAKGSVQNCTVCSEPVTH